jgi:hypothetical protein
MSSTNPIPNNLDICQIVKSELIPEYVVEFRRLIPLIGFQATNDNGTERSLDEFSLGEAHLRRASFFIALELPLRQTWNQRRVVLNDLISTIGLAPGEKVSFRIRHSQRDRLDRKTMRSKTEVLSNESSIVDKEVLSATRSSVRNENWSMTSSGKVSLGVSEIIDIEGGNSGSVGVNLQKAATQSAELVREATKSSSEQLTLTQRIEVSESRETFVEEEERREFTNPYTDRSLQLHFYDMKKEYDVTNKFEIDNGDLPGLSLVLDFERLNFGVPFVRRNIAFLEAHLQERHLLDEYLQLLRDPDVSFDQEYSVESQRTAIMALDYLFRVDNIFGFEDNDVMSKAWRSFQSDPDFGDSALNDALNERIQLSRLYTGIAYFHQVYQDLLINPDGFAGGYLVRSRPGVGDPPAGLPNFASYNFGSFEEIAQFKVDLAVALADFIVEHGGAATEEQLRFVMDRNQAGEIFRRMFGFTAMIHGMVVPRRREEEALRGRNRRLAAIEARIAEHLDSYNGFYRQRYVEYIGDNMQTVEFLDTFRDIHPLFDNIPSIEDLAQVFSFESGYIEGSRYIIPGYFSGNQDGIQEVLSDLLVDAPNFFDPDGIPNVISHQFIKLPVDGVHVEAVPGFCRLHDVPDKCQECNVDISVKGSSNCSPD